MMKLNISVLLKQIGFLIIIVFPFDTYRFNTPVISLSFFRILLILLTVFNIFNLFYCKQRIDKLGLFLVFISLISSFFTYLLTDFYVDSIPLLFNEIMGFLLIFNFMIIYDFSDLRILLKLFVIANLTPIFYSIWIISSFLLFGEIQFELPIPDVLSGIVVTGEFEAANFSGLPRLWMPFMTSPQLAISIALAIIFLLFMSVEKGFFKTYKNLLLIIFFAILVGTFSRSLFIALIFSIFVSFLSKPKRFLLFLIPLMLLIVLVPVISSNEFVESYISRMSRHLSSNIKEDRHFLLVLEGLRIWTLNIKNFFIGMGMGNNSLYKGFYTFLPSGSSFLSTYITTVAERGVIGFTMVFSSFYYLFYRLKSRKLNSDVFAVYISFFCIFVAFFFYDFRTTLSTWMLLAISFVAIKTNEINL